jgi:DNA modification methylase
MKLTKKLIEASINKDKVNYILIPFSGSGSESVVIKTLGHNYLGFDMNEDYVTLAKEWLKETKKED